MEQAGLILLNLTSWDIYNQVTEYTTDTEIIQRNLPNIVLRKLKPVFLSKIKILMVQSVSNLFLV